MCSDMKFFVPGPLNLSLSSIAAVGSLSRFCQCDAEIGIEVDASTFAVDVAGGEDGGSAGTSVVSVANTRQLDN